MSHQTFATRTAAVDQPGLAGLGRYARTSRITRWPQRDRPTNRRWPKNRPHFPPRVKRVIHLFMNGGPSQMDTFDPKPELNRLDGQPLPESMQAQLQPTQRNRVGRYFWIAVQVRQAWRERIADQRVVPQRRQACRRFVRDPIDARRSRQSYARSCC